MNSGPGLTLEQARLPDVIVALRMLGGPVSHDHGGPVRLYVAPMYGYKSIKWLSGIELTKDVVPGYWEHRGYAIDDLAEHSNFLEVCYLLLYGALPNKSEMSSFHRAITHHAPAHVGRRGPVQQAAIGQ